MLASTVEVPLRGEDLIYEPKYDGVRTLALLVPGRPRPSVRLTSRLGNDKTAQFPEIARELERFAKERLKTPLLLDGEIVALDDRGRPVSFQHLQGRIHVKSPSKATAADAPVAFVAFDLLREGGDDLRGLPLTARRARLERVFNDPGSPLLRMSPQVAHDGRELYRQALADGWEGLIAKRASSRYFSGKRSTEWHKLKLIRAQEFVVGGWTAPRGARSHFGALLLGVYEGRKLVYVGHVGSGFNEKELNKLMALLRSRQIDDSPFDVPPPETNDAPHWVKPELVAEVKFTEWTDDHRLRHPTYLGLRDDVKASTIRREPNSKYSVVALNRLGDRPDANSTDVGPSFSSGNTPARKSQLPRAKSSATHHRTAAPQHRSTAAPQHRSTAAPQHRSTAAPQHRSTAALQRVLDQLDDFEHNRRKGALMLPDGDTLDVGNLEKVFWPELKLTKGDLLRYYVRVSPYILPVVDGRPLVMKRYPNGINSQAFYQHRAPDPLASNIPTVSWPDDDVPSRIVGGSLKTLLYLTQLAAISEDPWFSRAATPHLVEDIAFDLDPMPGTSFDTVLDVARWLRDELEHVGVTGVPKTSGADGLHVYVRMPPKTTYDAGRIWAQIVATMVATKHPKVATVERTVSRRGAKVYVDYLQNIEGKTLACAYSARASAFAGASTPVSWDEVDEGFDRRDFTIQTLPDRLASVGDLWKPVLRGKPADLRRVEKYLKGSRL
jgi:bifunctional non-homologous end joining protein LigD